MMMIVIIIKISLSDNHNDNYGEVVPTLWLWYGDHYDNGRNYYDISNDNFDYDEYGYDDLECLKVYFFQSFPF